MAVIGGHKRLSCLKITTGSRTTGIREHFPAVTKQSPQCLGRLPALDCPSLPVLLGPGPFHHQPLAPLRSLFSHTPQRCLLRLHFGFKPPRTACHLASVPHPRPATFFPPPPLSLSKGVIPRALVVSPLLVLSRSASQIFSCPHLPGTFFSSFSNHHPLYPPCRLSFRSCEKHPSLVDGFL